MQRKQYYTKTGKKRYLVLGKDGKIQDNQSFKNAHSADIKRSSKAERTAKVKRAVRKEFNPFED